jgi:hypothetical protein
MRRLTVLLVLLASGALAGACSSESTRSCTRVFLYSDPVCTTRTTQSVATWVIVVVVSALVVTAGAGVGFWLGRRARTS